MLLRRRENSAWATSMPMFTVTSELAPKYQICAYTMLVTDQWLLLLITGLENIMKN